jgi:hypothetical protein
MEIKKDKKLAWWKVAERGNVYTYPPLFYMCQIRRLAFLMLTQQANSWASQSLWTMIYFQTWR